MIVEGIAALVTAGGLPFLLDLAFEYGDEKLTQYGYAGLLNIGLNGAPTPSLSFPPPP